MTENLASELDEESNLYILYETPRLGPPYGIFEACCEGSLMESFSEPVEILAEFPGRGDLLGTMHNRLKLYTIREGVPWFETTLEIIFSTMGEIMDESLHSDQVHHFAAMEQD